jgi:hypothetical protein
MSLLRNSFLYFHSFKIGYKTKETFIVTKVSFLFYAIFLMNGKRPINAKALCPADSPEKGERRDSRIVYSLSVHGLGVYDLLRIVCRFTFIVSR